MEATFILFALVVGLIMWAGVDLTITVASVQAALPVTTQQPLVAGETLTQGQSVYLKTSDNKWYKAQCDGTAEEAGSATRFGIAMNAALSGQTCIVQEGGTCTLGATVTVGAMYCISDTAGGICLQSAVPTASKITILGQGATSTTLNMALKSYTGYTVP